MGKLDETLATLRAAAEQSDSVMVAYSGGKDSMCVMDLCCRTFKRVEAFHMYWVPGLASEEKRLELAKTRWGVNVRAIPHWASLRSLRTWAYCDQHPENSLVPDWQIADIYEIMRLDGNCGFVAVGAKKADGAWRRRFLKGTEDWKTVLNPIAEWNKFDTLGYLKAQGLPIPAARDAKTATGIDLSMRSVQWLWDTCPEDVLRICEYFPYAMVPVKHREFFGGKDEA